MKDGKYIDSSGTERWYLNGKRHREDGPATIHTNGTEQWWQHGKRHREDGPAILLKYKNTKYWYINNEELTESEFLIWKEGKEFDEMMRELLTE